MNPLRVWATNYRTFDDLELDLPAGCCTVIGDNGAGKSSIVNLIDLALFAGRGELAGHLAEAGEDTELELGLEFEHAGDTYRVQRGYSARRTGKPTLDFARWDWGEHSAAWAPLTRDTLTATQQEIEETIGLSRATFRASAFLAQGDGAAFTEAQPRDRKTILAQVLGLDLWDRLHAVVMEDRRKAEQQAAIAAVEIERCEKDLGDRPTLEAQHTAARQSKEARERELVDSESMLTDVEKRVARSKEQRAALDVALANQKTADAELSRLGGIAREALEAQPLVAEIERQLAALPTPEDLDLLEQAENELRERCEQHARQAETHKAGLRERELVDRQREAIRAQARDHFEKAARMRTRASELEESAGEEKCERCGQTLGAEARASTIASLRTDADDLDATGRDLRDQSNHIPLPDLPVAPEGGPPTDEYGAAVRALREAREQASHAGTLRERRGNLQQKIRQADDPDFKTELGAAGDTATALSEKVTALTAEVPGHGDVDALERKAASLRHEISGLRDWLNVKTAEVAQVNERLAQLDRTSDQLADARQRHTVASLDVDELKLLERAYGRDGVPALIVENAAIPQIELEASRILEQLGTPYRIDLRTQKATKTGDVRDALDIVIVSPAGERAYETFSGGERTRLNLALRIALARLLAHRRGAESKVLVVDEPEFLDEAGTERLANVLRGLAGDFERILLVSHVTGLRDAFEQTLVVVKDGGRSRIETEAAAPLEVAA